MVCPLLLAVLAGSSLTMAGIGRSVQPPPADAPAAQPPSDSDALRGPTLTKHPDRPEHSIVERDFNGKLRKLEDNPALVALHRLSLTPEQRAAAEKVVGDRAAALDTIVRDNLRLLVELAQAMQSGDTQSAGRLQAQAMEKAGPFLKRGPLVNELRPVLPEDTFAELRRMVDEYNALAAEDRMGDPMSGPRPGNKFGAMLAQGFEGFAAEARASYQRVVGQGGKDFENLIKILQLTPEQESAVRRIATDLFQKTYGKPTKRQQLRVFLDIYAELNPDQRRILAEHIGEERKVHRPAASEAPRPADPAKPEADEPMMKKP